MQYEKLKGTAKGECDLSVSSMSYVIVYQIAYFY